MKSRDDLTIMAAALFGTVLLVGGVIAVVAGFGMADVKNTHTARIEDRATEKAEVSVPNADAVSAAPAVTAIAEAALPDALQMSAPKTPPVQMRQWAALTWCIPTPRR